MDKNKELSYQQAWQGLVETNSLIKSKFDTEIDPCILDKVKVAIERATPKAPIELLDGMGNSTLGCCCCEYPIVNVWSTAKYKPAACHYCGQVIKWGGEVSN